MINIGSFAKFISIGGSATKSGDPVISALIKSHSIKKFFVAGI